MNILKFINFFFFAQDEGIFADVMLFSLIALEKFAQKSENRATIKVSMRAVYAAGTSFMIF